MKKSCLIFLSLAAVALLLARPAQDKIAPQQLTLEKLFRIKPFQGTTARAMAFSLDHRWLAFLWNPYGQRGTDLYVCDTSSGQARRVTSLELMARFDTPDDHQKYLDKAKQKDKEDELQQKLYEAESEFLQGKNVDLSLFEKEQIEALKQEWEKKKAEEAKKLSEKKEGDQKEAKKEELKEDWEWRDELKKKLEKEKIKPEDLYPGVSRFVWAKKADELIFEYRGDLFRYFPGSNAVERLTMTDRRETILAYTPAGDGYFWRDEERVFRARFGSSLLQQINHELNPEDKFKIQDTEIAPDGSWMAIVAAKKDEKAGEKEVQIANFKGRFVEATKVKRETPDDKRHEPEYRLYIRAVRDNNWGKEPKPVFTIPGGDVWYEFSNVRWSKNSAAYVFSTWEREKGKLKIWLGQADESKAPEAIYENKVPLGRETYSSVDARFTPDGKKVVAILDESGFLQPYVLDLQTRQISQLVTGDFESRPLLGFTPDSRYLFILSNRENPAMSSVYRVEIAGGRMERIGKPAGMHRASSVSEDGRLLASVYGNWSARPELYLIDPQKRSEKILTDSHDQEWERLNLLQPQLFDFKNRHGDTIRGMVFRPAGWQPGDRRPAIVYVYGGPLGSGHTVESDALNTSAYHFQMYMAVRHGFVGVSIDPRGQSGYGRRFDDANFEQPGRPQVEDLEDLVKFMQSGFGVDTGRLGLYGWSFGGFQTQMTLYTSPDTFACGIAGAGPTEWENYNSWYTGLAISPSVRDKPAQRKFSLLPLARNLKKPLLLVHGMADDNVLFQDTINVYKALLEAGKEALVELFLDPEGSHGLGGLVKTKARFKKYEEFFLHHLGNG